LERLGLDLEKAQHLKAFYEAAASAGEGGATAPARAALMDDYIRILGGG
jgi:hypothetical protein